MFWKWPFNTLRQVQNGLNFEMKFETKFALNSFKNIKNNSETKNGLRIETKS